MYIYTCTYINIHMYKHTYTFIFIHVVSMLMCLYVCTHVCVYMYIHTHAHTHTHMYVYIYMHIYVCPYSYELTKNDIGRHERRGEARLYEAVSQILHAPSRAFALAGVQKSPIKEINSAKETCNFKEPAIRSHPISNSKWPQSCICACKCVCCRVLQSVAGVCVAGCCRVL